MASQYLELNIVDFPSQEEDLLVECLFSLGAEGVSENLPFMQEDQYLQVTMIEKDLKNIVAYFSAVNLSELTESIKTRFPDIKILAELKQTKDWLEEWKKSFVPFELAQGIWICPSWCKAPAEAKEVLFLEPGMSFGTGTHPTTQLCSDVIVELYEKYQFSDGLDVGCGTGILSILMSKLGVKNIFAFDIDPESHRVCQENMEKNQVQNICWEPRWESCLLKTPALVVANIIDGTLRDLRPLLLNVMPQGSFLVLSGILVERAQNFEDFFIKPDFDLVDKRQKQDWTCLVLRKK